jgi:hypothetical protein
VLDQRSAVGRSAKQRQLPSAGSARLSWGGLSAKRKSELTAGSVASFQCCILLRGRNSLKMRRETTLLSINDGRMVALEPRRAR